MKRFGFLGSLVVLAVLLAVGRPTPAVAASVSFTDLTGGDDSGMIIWDGDFDVLTMGFDCNPSASCIVTPLGSISPSAIAAELTVSGPSALTFSQLSLLVTVGSCSDATFCKPVDQFAEGFKPASDVCWDPTTGTSSDPDSTSHICNTTDPIPDVAILPLTLPSSPVDSGTSVTVGLTTDAQTFLSNAESADAALWQAGMAGFAARFSESGVGLTGVSEEKVTLSLGTAATTVPEPASLFLLGAGVAALLGCRGRRG